MQLFQLLKDLFLLVLVVEQLPVQRVESIALDAELHGATAVVLNAPTTTEFVQESSR